MKMLQGKTFLIGLFCGCSVAAYAGGDSDYSGGVIPEQIPGFGGSITGLYLQPNANNLNYAVYTVPLPLPAPNWYQQSVKPSYDAAFALGMHYNFLGKTDQVALDWLHFDSRNSAKFTPTEPNTSVGPPYYFGPSEQFLLNTSANSSVKFNVDNINLEFGHLRNLTKNTQVKLRLGASMAHLKEDITNNYSGSDPVFGPYRHQVRSDSSLTGFGPRLGLDASYFVNRHFGVNAGIGSSLLVGRLASSTNFTSWTAFSSQAIPTNNVPVNTTLSNQHQTAVIPELDGKLGLFYTTEWNDSSSLTVEVGYMFQDYINSIYQVLPSTLVPTSWEAGTVAIISQASRQSDLSLNGPYLRLAYK